MKSALRYDFARMILGGPGCRLQTCGRLATEWFDSTSWVSSVDDVSDRGGSRTRFGHVRDMEAWYLGGCLAVPPTML